MVQARRPSCAVFRDCFPSLPARSWSMAGAWRRPHPPTLLLIDELSLGLAPRMVELLSERLRDINRSGVALLLVEQDVMNALELADRAYVIDRGRVTKSGASKNLAGDPVIREAYMGI